MGGQDDIDKLGAGEQEALISARLGDIRKKVNAESWSPNMEKLIADWGEKAAGLRFMHSHSGSSWKNFGNNLAITGILVTSIASSISLVATSVEDIEIKNGILFGVGGVGMVSALIQSFKKFYNAEEKAADHASVSKQEAPPLTGNSIKAFKSKFSNKEQAIPDIAEDKFVIHVTRPPIVPENKITFVKETVKINDVELGNSSD